MTRFYKLTDSAGRTRNGTAWGPGIDNPVLTGDGDLCGPGWYHAYTDPLLAVLLDPIHGRFGSGARMFWFESDETPRTDHGPKVGLTRIEFGGWLPPLEVTTE